MRANEPETEAQPECCTVASAEVAQEAWPDKSALLNLLFGLPEKPQSSS